jgi:hypothetical protein
MNGAVIIPSVISVVHADIIQARVHASIIIHVFGRRAHSVVHADIIPSAFTRTSLEGTRPAHIEVEPSEACGEVWERMGFARVRAFAQILRSETAR